MRIDPSAAAVLEAMAAARQPGVAELTPVEARAALRKVRVERTDPPVLVETVRDITDGAPVPVRLYHPGGGMRPALIYFHGGGWVIGDLDTHDRLCRRIASESGLAVISVDYPLAPEHPFPAALDAALAAWNWVASGAVPDVDPGRLAIGGDSAGGNIAAVTVNTLGAVQALKAQVLIYPCTDLTGGSIEPGPAAKAISLTDDDMRWFIDHYLGGHPATDPRVSPRFVTTTGPLPPTCVVMAGYDVLAPEGYAYAKWLDDGGTATKVFDFPGQIHGFVSNPDCEPEGTQAIAAIAEFLRARLL